MYQVKLEKFEGPLELLLELIQEEELDISQIALAQVTDQYLSYMNKYSREIDLEELVDFLVVAARLLFIKSRTLLPLLNISEDEDGKELEKQLRIYREYHEASKKIEQLILKKPFSFSRPRMVFSFGEIRFSPPKFLNIEKLKKVMGEILHDLEPLRDLDTVKLERTVQLGEKITEIRNLLNEKSNFVFSSMVQRAKNKYEMIISFLALLELVKQRTLLLSQNEVFGEITVYSL